MIDYITMASLLGMSSHHNNYNDERHSNMVKSHKSTIYEQVLGKDISSGRQCGIMKRH